jgi:glutamate carboxypeptidase
LEVIAPALLAYCRGEELRLIEAIETLARLESPSTDKAAVDRCGEAIAVQGEALGGEVDRLRRDLRGNHVRIEFQGDGPRVMLLGHFDTVWDVGQIRRMPVVRRDGKLHGPGVFDMKSGIAVAMLSMRAIAAVAVPAPRVVMLWTTDEEVGSGTSREAIEEEARRSDAVLVLEPSLPGGAAKTSRKGCGDFDLTVRGVSAHAGIDPGKGASAIHELAHQITTLTALQDLARGVSVNIGTISGGTRTNVVAELAQASVDLRVPTMEDAARIETAVRGLKPRLEGTSVELTGGFGRPPLERSPHVIRLYETAREVARRLGMDLAEGGTGGGSDGNFTAALGVPTLDGLGPMGDGAHALHEHVLISDLTWRAAFVAALVVRLGGVK